MNGLRKNEIPSLCRFTLAQSSNFKVGPLTIMIVTANDKAAKIPTGFERIGKSYLGSRDVESDPTCTYPHGKEIMNGTYVWLAPAPLQRWQKIKA